MKKLVTKKTVFDLKQKGIRELVVNDNFLITPSAKDALKEYEIKIVNEKDRPSGATCECIMNQSECAPSNNPVQAQDDQEISEKDIVEMVMRVLEEKGLLD